MDININFYVIFKMFIFLIKPIMLIYILIHKNIFTQSLIRTVRS